MRYLILALWPFVAQACPPQPEYGAEYTTLLMEIRAAENEMEARELSARLWGEYWTRAPDEVAQQLLDSGMEALRYGDFLRANEQLDRLVGYCPDFAEGYNQRAFVAFLQDDFAAALADLDRTLEITPTHIGALSGRALSLIGMGRDAEGQAALREALELNPWLSERHLLTEPAGEDI